MFYSDFQGKKISKLAFGTMRLPLKEDKKTIDEEKLSEMVKFCFDNGVNYFDTAYPYHGGMSEFAIGKALSKYPRGSFFLASKFPGHQISESYNPEEIFEIQLKKCGVEYFDFYLLHNVYEKSFDVYNDKKWGIIDYFLEQKRLGRIKHLGFSSHARVDTLKKFLDLYGDKMEFCQIQLNYLDWTLQEAKEKYELLKSRNIPVWVMEPVRGGRLSKLSKDDEETLKNLRPEDSVSSWAFRWLLSLPEVSVVLSGMSNIEQMKDNVKTFSEDKPLTKDEFSLLLSMAENMKNSLPCTACRYCCDGCPKGLDIPFLISGYNDVRFGLEGGLTAAMQIQSLPEEKRPTACISCGACSKICPQKIDIPKAMSDFSEALKKLPDWEKVSRERNLEAVENLKKL